MNRAQKTLVLIMAIVVIVGIILSPLLLMFTGFGVWILMWLAQGGVTEGNPYKRMKYTAIPNFVEVKDYMRKQDIEERDNASAAVTFLFFGIGLVLVVAGALMMWLQGF